MTLTPEQEEFLTGYAAHYNMVERKLYADMQKSGKSAASFKNAYLLEYKITARQFNAIARNLEGKISSVLELLPLYKQELEAKIAKAKKVIPKIKNPDKAHQKKRRIFNLETRLTALNQQIEAKDPSICFGSRSLFRKQFYLEENGYANHAEWKADWDAKRNSQFYILGSHDETGGCQGCVISVNLDGSFNLRVRKMGKETEYVWIRDVHIPYGQDVIRQAVRNEQAISYRFLRDSKGWRVFITTDVPKVEMQSIKDSGKIGVDINADCLAVSEIDRFGNLCGTRVIPLVTYGKSSDQAEALIGEAVKDLVDWAVTVSKPIVIENLNFSKKKAELEAEEPKYARMLSSFSCNKIIQGIKSRAFRHGIEVIERNPAYTSIIGLVNYAKRHGLSSHQSAAYVIARRGSGFRERPITEKVEIPTPKGDHVTFPLPVRNRGKHLWSFWSTVRTSARAVLAAHCRPPSGDPEKGRTNAPLKRKCPLFSVKPREANRQQHCLADVMGEIPW